MFLTIVFSLFSYYVGYFVCNYFNKKKFKSIIDDLIADIFSFYESNLISIYWNKTILNTLFECNVGKETKEFLNKMNDDVIYCERIVKKLETKNNLGEN
jgi:hypothetical protein